MPSLRRLVAPVSCDGTNGSEWATRFRPTNAADGTAMMQAVDAPNASAVDPKDPDRSSPCLAIVRDNINISLAMAVTLGAPDGAVITPASPPSATNPSGNQDCGPAQGVSACADVHSVSARYSMEANTEYILRIAVETTRGNDATAEGSAMSKALRLASATSKAEAVAQGVDPTTAGTSPSSSDMPKVMGLAVAVKAGESWDGGDAVPSRRRIAGKLKGPFRHDPEMLSAVFLVSKEKQGDRIYGGTHVLREGGFNEKMIPTSWVKDQESLRSAAVPALLEARPRRRHLCRRRRGLVRTRRASNGFWSAWCCPCPRTIRMSLVIITKGLLLRSMPMTEACY